MTIDPNLKPCPFCGYDVHADDYETILHAITQASAAAVQCGVCQMRGPWMSGLTMDDSKRRAVKAWNDRRIPTPAAAEPALPEGVTLGEDQLHQVAYKGWGKLGGIIDIAACNWTPTQLRAIADHMEYRERQVAKVPEVTDAMISAAWAAWCDQKHGEKTMSTVIAAALRAMKTET